MNTILVVCIGNVARGDDGVAHAVARLLTKGDLSAETRIITLPDLDVALAEDVANAGLFILVDAARREGPPVVVEPLASAPASRHTGHGIDPGSLLALATSLWGRAPRAITVTVAAPLMGHGEELSATAEAASVEAASVVLDLTCEAQTS